MPDVNPGVDPVDAATRLCYSIGWPCLFDVLEPIEHLFFEDLLF